MSELQLMLDINWAEVKLQWAHLLERQENERAAFIRDLKDQGASQQKIATELDLGQQYVSRLVQFDKTVEKFTPMGVTSEPTERELRPYIEAASEAVADERGVERVPYKDRDEVYERAAEAYQEAHPSAKEEKPTPREVLTLYTHDGQSFEYPKPKNPSQFTQQAEDSEISWAKWSWNPVTGCLHGCDYCYARAIAHRFKDTYPAGFTPLFHEERLAAPANTSIPRKYRDDSHPNCSSSECMICAYRRVFVCSMADLYGGWVPDKWIEKVHAAMLANPQWQYILLTKYPKRYIGLDLPPDAWVGTSVDEQKRVKSAEDAFRQIDGVRVKWLSLEPLLTPLEFTDLSVFDWVVIGAQTETHQPDHVVPAFESPLEWVLDLRHKAEAVGCAVHEKPNLARSLRNNFPS